MKYSKDTPDHPDSPLLIQQEAVEDYISSLSRLSPEELKLERINIENEPPSSILKGCVKLRLVENMLHGHEIKQERRQEK